MSWPRRLIGLSTPSAIALPVIVVGLVMLGLAITNGSDSTPSTTAQVVSPTPTEPAPVPTLPPAPLPTPPPQVVQIEIVVKQEPGAPQVLRIEQVAPLTAIAPPPAPAVTATPTIEAPAPPCSSFGSQAALTGWLLAHPEHADNLLSCVVNQPPAAPQVFVTTQVLTATPAPSATPTRTPTPSPTPTATPVLTHGTVVVNFAGAPGDPQPTRSEAFAVEPGSTAWLAVQQAIGIDNLIYDDFGGDLGIFISGFYGTVCEWPTCFWEFFVNGVSSFEGVSQYEVQEGDVLEFRIG
jgi:hypothetical protein